MSRVFGIGWAKTGTKTLGQCFRILNYTHQSQRLDLINDLTTSDLSRIRSVAEKSESFEDWPWILLFRQLDEMFPDSKFVLTTREPDSWLRSYRGLLRRQGTAREEINEIRRALYGLPFPDVTDAQLVDRYLRHNRDVRAYFRDRPGDLLVANWFQGDSWPQLCSFLGKAVPCIPFPHENKAPADTQGPPDSTSITTGEFLRTTAGDQPIYWCPNPGNGGDSLIAAGSVEMFRRYGIPFRYVEEPDTFDSKGRIVCFGGGGNLVGYYDHARSFLARHHANAKRLILLPHTVEGHEDLLGTLGSNVTLICREAVSYDYCRRAAPKAEVCTAEDLALSLTPEEFLRSPGAGIDRARLESYCDFVAPKRQDGLLEVWRCDCEVNSRRPHAQRGDISFRLHADMTLNVPAPLETHLRAAAYLLHVVDSFDAVRTDRLHVAIAGALLGKEVELYPNSTYKNRAVYDFSLKRFANVRFVDWA